MSRRSLALVRSDLPVLLDMLAPDTGDRLPPERDLALRLGCSRETLRKALAALETDGAIWRHVGQVRLIMRVFSDAFLDAYLARNWESVRWCVGGYKLEEEGVRLFSRIDGDYFNVLGLPLVEILSYLSATGDLDA